MYLVVFRNRKRADIDWPAYRADLTAMEAAIARMPGFLGNKSYAAEDGEAINMIEWESREASLAWRADAGHAAVQGRGRAAYYESYTLFAGEMDRVNRFP